MSWMLAPSVNGSENVDQGLHDFVNFKKLLDYFYESIFKG